MDWNKSKFFKEYEFDSPDLPGSGEKMNWDFVLVLNWLRLWVGQMLLINSGYRTPVHNLAIDGSEDSSHMKGLAVDIKCYTNELRFKIVKYALILGFERIGVYKDHIHLDMDKSKPAKIMWYGEYPDPEDTK